MSGSRDLSTIQLAPADRFKSTTARLLVSFCLSYFKVLKALFNSVTADATIQYATIGQLDTKEDLLNNAAAIMSDVKDALDKLDVVISKGGVYSLKNEYEVEKRDVVNHLTLAGEVDQKGVALQRDYRQDRDKILQSLDQLFKALISAKDPDEKAHSQEILNELSKVKQNCERLKTEFRQVENAVAKSTQQLEIDLNSLAKFAPPGTIKTSSPVQLTPTPQGGSSG